MNIKSAAIAAVVRLLADNTTLIRKETPAENFFGSLFGFESPEQRVAREAEVIVDKTVDAVKRARTNRKFKKIVENV
jgi:hypothetical protein